MPIRNRHKVGDYLMMDDESGLVHYHSDMVERWDGVWVHHRQNETRNPQEFVMAMNDPKSLRHIRPEPKTTEPGDCTVAAPVFVGETTIAAKHNGPGYRFFDPGIGEMCVGSTFYVRSDDS